MMYTIIFLTWITQVYPDEGSVIVAVGEASLESSSIVFEKPRKKGPLSAAQKSSIEELYNLFTNDFSYYKKRFSVSKLDAKPLKKDAPPSYKKWEEKEIHYFFRFFFQRHKKSKNLIKYDIRGYDVKQKRQIIMETGKVARKNIRRLGHEITNKAYKKIEGKKSIFQSEIVFVSDRTGHKELYITDFDGFNTQRLTAHRGIVISPAISLNRKKIVYSLIDSKRRYRNINLYIYDRAKKRTRMVSSRKGINSGAIFTPNGKNLILTLSFLGNAEIYNMNLKTRRLRRITRHYSLDVDPSLSSDGRILAFLSSRSGRAMIHTLNPKGQELNVQRISFVGQFNATPRFNPFGSEMAFAAWSGRGFDIYRINADRSGLVRLTKNFGSNEDPSYSNDGQFIVFSSKKLIDDDKAEQNIFIMDRDGEILGPITNKFGNCATPRWSK
ncbi:MAG: hypothetical protein OXB84_05070 [Halobacteriovoraceae bacterium]|nr:hypothetical protein [Halobacteriovoraceae bacterium]